MVRFCCAKKSAHHAHQFHHHQKLTQYLSPYITRNLCKQAFHLRVSECVKQSIVHQHTSKVFDALRCRNIILPLPCHSTANVVEDASVCTHYIALCSQTVGISLHGIRLHLRNRLLQSHTGVTETFNCTRIILGILKRIYYLCNLINIQPVFFHVSEIRSLLS